jgi:uncharacterized membrane protein
VKEKVRYVSADLLRGLVIIIMIEVHVFNAFLLTDLKYAWWFGILNFINGLVAPSFLFVSGFAFQVSSGNKLDEMRKFGKAFWKKMQRIFQIVIIGYMLHIPFYSLSKTIHEATPEIMMNFYAVDILQCIGVGLLYLYVFRLFIKSDKVYNYFLIFSFIVISITSSFIWQVDFNNYLHPFFSSYFNTKNGSLFPIFPWISFLLAGAIFAKYFVDAREKNEEAKFIKGTAVTGFATLILGHIFFTPLFPYSIQAVKPHIVFLLERVGYVLFILTLCWYVDKKYNVKKSFILDASRESLLVYWLHLVIIYGTFWSSKSLANIIGSTMNVAEAIGTTLSLIILMIIVAKIWGWAKRSYPKYASLFVKFFVAALIIVYILK